VQSSPEALKLMSVGVLKEQAQQCPFGYVRLQEHAWYQAIGIKQLVSSNWSNMPHLRNDVASTCHDSLDTNGLCSAPAQQHS
jgi:hypothetical protein